MASGDGGKVNWSGLTSAAAAAPGLSLLALFVIGAAATLAGDANGPGSLGGFIGGGLLLLAVVTVWGFLPALLFGGLVVAALRHTAWATTVPGRTAAGVFAAALYVLCGLALALLLPPLAFLLAPWAVLFREEGLAAVGWPIVGIVASGAPAGLIYAAFERRG